VGAIANFYRGFLDRLSGQPGVISAGGVMSPPLSRSGFGGSFVIIGRTGGDTPRMQVRPVTPGYFETLRIPLRRGRLIAKSDRPGSANVVVISEEAARKYWPGEDPIGKRIRIHVALGVPEREREIVGVVGDVKIRTLDAAAVPVAYVPHEQYVSDQLTILVRAAGDPMALLPLVRTQLAQLDREIALTDVGPATQLAAKAVAQPRFRTIVLSLFACVALALAAVGLYGVTAYSVSQRRAELGVRMALGAESRQVVRLVLREGLMPVAVGIAIGIAGAAVLTRVISTLLFDVAALDPLTFATVPVLLAIVAITACYLPARRASTVDPLTVLRE
jgi:putative ABC transport system permease protein